MKKYLIMLLTFSVIFAQDIARVKLLKGDVKASLNGAVIQLKLGEHLSQSMVIQTGLNSSITIVFNDNSILILGPNSIINLKKYIFEPKKKEYDFKLFLKTGAAVFESGDIGKYAPESFIFETPQGTVAIRGTKFVVNAQ